jgi:hypothetical protein
LRTVGLPSSICALMDKQLPDDKGQLLEMYDAVSFSRDAIARFPALYEELRKNENQLHVQMAVLARAVYDALHRNEIGTAMEVFGFLDQVLRQPRAISGIANAVAISFVELSELLRTDQGRLALDSMPDRVKAAIQQNHD